MNKKITKLEASNNNKYKVEAFSNSIVYAQKSKSEDILSFYYLVL